MRSHKFQSVDEYLEHAPPQHFDLLQQVRKTIQAAIPEAEEVISYNMPAYRYQGILVYFSLADKHLGFYPTPSGIAAFKSELNTYKHGKGSIQFPLNEEVPLNLISAIAKFRFNEIQKKKTNDKRYH